MNRIFTVVFAFMLSSSVFSQNSIFDNSEATPGAVRNLSQYASTNMEAVIYNPAGLAFSDKVFQISLGGIGGYQVIENKPFTLNDYDDAVYDMSHWSSIIQMIPSVQAYCGFGNLSLSMSCSNEGGGGVWRDLYGNEIMDSFFHEYEKNSSQWANIVSVLQQFVVNDEDAAHLYSKNFQSRCCNYCVRIGATYLFSQHFSGYFGCKANAIYYSHTIDGGVFIHRPSTKEKWLFSDYLMSTKGLINNDYDMLDEQILDNIKDVIEGNSMAFACSPLIGFDFNYDNLNIGMKYEMSPNVIINNKNVMIPHDFSIGASYKCFNNKVNVSIGADFKWGFCSIGNMMTNAIVRINNPYNINMLYAVVLGVDRQVNKRLLVSASTAFGNSCYAMRGTGIYWECPVGIDKTPARFSLGVQYNINNRINFDMGFSMNPFTNVMTVNSTNNFVNTGIQTISHCDYRYMPRFATGLGLTYSF